MKTFKSVLITGANGNLGRLLAQKLSSQGMDVLCFDLPGTDEVNKSSFKKIRLLIKRNIYDKRN